MSSAIVHAKEFTLARNATSGDNYMICTTEEGRGEWQTLSLGSGNVTGGANVGGGPGESFRDVDPSSTMNFRTLESNDGSIDIDTDNPTSDRINLIRAAPTALTLNDSGGGTWTSSSPITFTGTIMAQGGLLYAGKAVTRTAILTGANFVQYFFYPAPVASDVTAYTILDAEVAEFGAAGGTTDADILAYVPVTSFKFEVVGAEIRVRVDFATTVTLRYRVTMSLLKQGER